MKLALVSLSAFVSLSPFAPPTYTVVGIKPNRFTVVQGIPLSAIVRDFHQTAIVVETKAGAPAPTAVEFDMGQGPWYIPITMAVSSPAGPGRVRWSCRTPHQLVPGLPVGPVEIRAVGNGARSGPMIGRVR